MRCAGMVQKLMISGNTLLGVQKAQSRGTEGFGLVVLYFKV
jgi:hypothetical protein